MAEKQIALIHALAVAVQPILDAFAHGWPEAKVTNLLDDGLTVALQREGGLTPRIVDRVCDLATYAARTGADGILFTCSAFTPAMDVAKRRVAVPLLKPDEAMVGAALEAGERIGLVATFPETIPVAECQFRAAAAERGARVGIVTAAVPEALQALRAGDAGAHGRLIADAAARLAPEVDVLCLAQFSMARARSAVEARTAVPVLTSPSAAVARLKALLNGSPPG